MEEKEAVKKIADNPTEISFSNGSQAKILTVPKSKDAAEIIRALGIKRPNALIMISGGASGLDDKLKARLSQLYSRAVARTAADVGALIIDGGTQSGVMEMMGQGVADRGCRSVLLGVAPEGKVAYPGGPTSSEENGLASLDKNHSHFVLVDGEDWGCETETMWSLARTMVNNVITPEEEEPSKTEENGKHRTQILERIRKKFGSAADNSDEQNSTQWQAKIPAVTVLANGGEISTQEILKSVRMGWPVIVIEGSGRLADKIAKLYRQKPQSIDDPALAEIICDGDIYPYQIDAPIEGMKRMIVRLLKEDATLRTAWEAFAEYDANAERQRSEFQWLQSAILILGVVGTFLALSQKTIQGVEEGFNRIIVRILGWLQWVPFLKMDTAMQDEFAVSVFSWIDDVLHIIILLFPIAIAILIAAANRFSAGNKWIFLRSSAEAIKRHIYRYRAKADLYNAKQTADITREAKLAVKLKVIRTHVNQSEVNLSAIRPYKGPIPPKYGAADGDDGFSNLTPEQYVMYRLDDQLKYYQAKTVKLEKQMKKLQWIIYGMSGVGTLLAAIRLEWWIALTTAIITALMTFMEYQKIEEMLMQFNQGATDLANIRGWWMALSSEEQARQENIDRLIAATEKYLEVESSGWMQEMQEALEELKAQQTSEETKKDRNDKKKQKSPKELSPGKDQQRQEKTRQTIKTDSKSAKT